MRLDKFLSNAGYGSRKEVKAILKQGRVTVNDILVKADNRNIDENNDIICVDNQKVNYQEFYYVLLNKPSGYVSATLPERHYPPVTDLVSEFAFAKLFPVGRLDVDTTGTLLLTNNGTLAHRLISPKYHVDKKYYVEVDYPLQKELIINFERGVVIDDTPLLPGKLEIIDEFKAYVTIHEGKYHQIKRMFFHYGYTVLKLDRVEFAFLNHKDLKLGEYRKLTKEEVNQLITLVESK